MAICYLLLVSNKIWRLLGIFLPSGKRSRAFLDTRQPYVSNVRDGQKCDKRAKTDREPREVARENHGRARESTWESYDSFFTHEIFLETQNVFKTRGFFIGPREFFVSVTDLIIKF